jgi:hypothetical protein
LHKKKKSASKDSERTKTYRHFLSRMTESERDGKEESRPADAVADDDGRLGRFTKR